jgi:hypothetical protein
VASFLRVGFVPLILPWFILSETLFRSPRFEENLQSDSIDVMVCSRLLCFPSFAERVFGKFNEQYLAIYEYDLIILANLAHLKLEIENIL